MKLLFVGDTHGEKDLGKLKAAWPSLGMKKSDAVIHCGDFGAPWIDDTDDALLWWQALPCKKIVCLGNHENFGWISRQPLRRRFGALGRDLGGGIFAPLAGQVLKVGGRTLWFYPGGLSIDFFLRTPGCTVFADELLTPEDAEKALENLRRHAPVDYIVSHDGPRSHVEARFGFRIGLPKPYYHSHFGEGPESRLHPGYVLDKVLPSQYGKWYFGHHHVDDEYGRLRCLFRVMVMEETRTGSIREIPPAL